MAAITMIRLFYGALLMCLPFARGAILTHCSYDTRENYLCGWQHMQANFTWTHLMNRTTPSAFTGPPGDWSFDGQGGYIYVEASSPRKQNETCHIRSPLLNARVGSSICFSVYAHMMGEGVGAVEVHLTTGTRRQALYSRRGDYDNYWYEVKLRMVVAEPSFYFSIIGIIGNSLYGDSAIDDMKVETCSASITGHILVSTDRLIVEYPPAPRIARVPFLCTFLSNRCGFSQARDDDFDWWRRYGETETDFTGPAAGHTTGASNDRYMLAESSEPQHRGSKARLVSPIFPPSDDNQLCLQFYYHMFGQGVGEFSVISRNWNCSTNGSCTPDQAAVVFTLSGDQGDKWQVGQVKIPTAGYITLEFEAVVGTFRSDIGLDDVSINTCNSSYVFEVPQIPKLPYPDGCSQPVSINGSSGFFVSDLRYPNALYESNMTCRWTINTQDPTKSVHLAFDADFYVEASERCEFDFVRVFDGLSDAELNEFLPCGSSPFPFKGPYCGSYAPANYISKTNHITVEFCTDGRNKRPGFGARWNQTEPLASPILTESCSRNISVLENGAIEYVKIPSSGWEYENNLNCRMRFKNANSNHSIIINTGSFDVEASTNCEMDYLEITESCKNTSQRFCGHMGPVQYRSECDEVVIKFVTDFSDVGKGFEIAVTGGTCTRGNFYCGTGDECIPESKVCDGVKNCVDGFDEDELVCNNLYECGIEAPSPPFTGLLGYKPESRHPWHVAVLSKTRRLACSATIIASNWIVTSAQCINRFSRLEDMILLLDSPVINFYAWPIGTEVTPDLVRIHPAFSADTLRHDIALIKFTPPAGLSALRMPICFSSADDSYLQNGTAVTLVGFAHIPRPNLARVNREPDRNITVFSNISPVTMLTRNYCNNISRNALDKDMICTTTSACETDGDLGAPLVVRRRGGAFHLVGVYSFSPSECRASYGQRYTPAVYSRINSYAAWMTDVIAKDARNPTTDQSG